MSALHMTAIGLALMINQSVVPECEIDDGCQSQIVYNSPTTPVRLTLSPNGKYIEATNYSAKQVKTLTFGCLVVDADGPSIKKRIQDIEHFDLAHIDLDPANWESSRLSMFAFPVDEKSVLQCKELGTLFSVIEAEFKDNSEWKLNSPSNDCAPTSAPDRKVRLLIDG